MSVHIEERTKNVAVRFVNVTLACSHAKCEMTQTYTGLAPEEAQVTDRDASPEEAVLKTFPTATEAARYLGEGVGWSSDGKSKDGCPKHPVTPTARTRSRHD